MEKTYKERIADALNKYKREMHLPRESKLVTNIMRKGEIVEKVYESPDGTQTSLFPKGDRK